MKKAVSGGVVGLFAVFAVACSVSQPTTDESTSTDDSALKVKHCGGFVANPQTCPTGYHCVANSIPDLPGTCKKNKCVQNELCAVDAHWDKSVCACVPNTCVQTVLCTTTSHFDSTLCRCVSNAT